MRFAAIIPASWFEGVEFLVAFAVFCALAAAGALWFAIKIWSRRKEDRR